MHGQGKFPSDFDYVGAMSSRQHTVVMQESK
jgi:hypothetical protein